MAQSFEELIADVVARGELTHLSVVSVAGGFAATFTPASGFGYTQTRHKDPVQAMRAAIEQTKLARPPKRTVDKPIPHYAPDDARKRKASSIDDVPDDDMDFG